MIPLNPLAYWRNYAQALRPAEFGFAMGAGFCDAEAMRHDCGFDTVAQFDCYPFPSLRSGSLRVRPLFLRNIWRQIAHRSFTAIFWFYCAKDAVESHLRTRNQRGSSPCVKPLSFSHFSRFRLPVASSPTPPPPVQALVPSLVRRLALSLTTTSRNPPLSVVLLASLQATRAFAADLAAQISNDIKASRGFTAAGFLHCYACAFGPAQASEGRAPCSRKS